MIKLSQFTIQHTGLRMITFYNSFGILYTNFNNYVTNVRY